MPAESIVLNGISGETGEYLVSPLQLSRVAALAKGEPADQGVVRWLTRMWRKMSRTHLGLPIDADPTDVTQAGWAVVFSTDEPQEVRDALGPLIEHRRAQADENKTKILDIRPGESWQQWLERHGDAPGNVTPTRVPFYLLLIGSPERISYETQYLLSVYHPEGEPLPEDVLSKIMADVDVVNQELQDAGAWVFAGGLHPSSTATVLKAKNGDVLLTDGPFVEGKEHIGGFWVINAPDLDSALEWGRKAARACQVPIEVRPFQDEPES